MPTRRPFVNLKLTAQSYTACAIRTLVSIMSMKDAPPAARVSAATALLDRGWGKPAQAVAVTGADGGAVEIVEISVEDAARRIAFALSAGVAAAQHEQPDGPLN